MVGGGRVDELDDPSGNGVGGWMGRAGGHAKNAARCGFGGTEGWWNGTGRLGRSFGRLLGGSGRSQEQQEQVSCSFGAGGGSSIPR